MSGDSVPKGFVPFKNRQTDLNDFLPKRPLEEMLKKAIARKNDSVR